MRDLRHARRASRRESGGRAPALAYRLRSPIGLARSEAGGNVRSVDLQWLIGRIARCHASGRERHLHGHRRDLSQRAVLRELALVSASYKGICLPFARSTPQRYRPGAISPNHYHFVTQFENPSVLRGLVRRLYSATAQEVNRLDLAQGRKVWFQYWDSQITFQGSYFARLRYVHENAVHHGIVRRASNYPCVFSGMVRKKSYAGISKDSVRISVRQIGDSGYVSSRCGSV